MVLCTGCNRRHGCIHFLIQPHRNIPSLLREWFGSKLEVLRYPKISFELTVLMCFRICYENNREFPIEISIRDKQFGDHINRSIVRSSESVLKAEVRKFLLSKTLWEKTGYQHAFDSDCTIFVPAVYMLEPLRILQ